MSAEQPEQPEQPEQHTAAHRPKLRNRFRLLPLLALVLCVITAGLVGALHGGRVSAQTPVPTPQSPFERQQASFNQAVRQSTACRPAYDPQTHGEPWEGKAKAASERVFEKKTKHANPVYIVGRHHWYFYNDLFDENFSQAIGRVTQSAKQEKGWARYLSGLDKAVRQGGGEFHVVIAPANWDVYHQNLPGWTRKLRGSTTLAHLLKDHPELPFIDTRAALAKAAKKQPTYEPQDGHWTPYGGWVAWKAILKCLRTNPALAALKEPPITGVGVEASSNEFADQGVPTGPPARTYPIFANPHPPVTVTHIPDGTPVPILGDGAIDMTYTPLMTRTPGAVSPLSLMVLRDSTGNAMTQEWDWTFGTTIQYQHGIGQTVAPPDVKALVAQYHPNVAMLVITERLLSHDAPK